MVADPYKNFRFLVEIDIPFRAQTEGTPAPSWTESPRSREVMPEVTLEEVSAWRTGEFAAAVLPAPSATRPPLGMDRPRQIVSVDPIRETRQSEPLIAAVEREHEPSTPFFSSRTWLLLVAIWMGTAGVWTAGICGRTWSCSVWRGGKSCACAVAAVAAIRTPKMVFTADCTYRPPCLASHPKLVLVVSRGG